MIYNAVAVDKHTENTTQYITVYWAGKINQIKSNQILEDIIKAVPKKGSHLSSHARG